MILMIPREEKGVLVHPEQNKRGALMKKEETKPISYNTIKRNTVLNRFFLIEEEEEESKK